MNTSLTFGNWLRERRNASGLTQEELSDHLGFSPAMMRKLESGERRPSSQIASLVADHFSVPPDEYDAFIAFARMGRGADLQGETAGYPFGTSDNISAPWRRTYASQTNLPALLTPLAGRVQEAETVRDLLLHSRARLLTLTGTAGIGKTRLALEVASSLRPNFDDGIYFVDLAPILDPNAVLPAVAHTLGLKEEGGRVPGSLEKMLLEYIRERRMLLILDNFEQVLDAASSVVTLMQASPWLKVLVTSREALRVRGERRFSVPPLSVPALEQFPQLDELARFPAIELFLERAREAAPDFELTQDNSAEIVALCAGLDGLPLAIELAASRAGHLSLADMTKALGNQLKLLTAGARDTPPRHRTLRGAIEWSYNLLDPGEQHLFRQMGVFVGGFTSEALESIVDAVSEGDRSMPRSTIDTLASLTDKSLVHRKGAKATKARPVELRFGLLEAVREYALEQLDARNETEETKRRHAEYYLSLADRSDKHFTGPQYPLWGVKQIEWIDRLETDLDNMRAALDWFEIKAEGEAIVPGEQMLEAEAYGYLEKGLRLVGDLRRIWFGRGYYAEGLQRLGTFLALVPAPLPIEHARLRSAYAVALLVTGRLAPLHVDQEYVDWAHPLLEEALGIFIELNDKQRAANARLILGSLAVARRDYPAARAHQRESLETYRGLDNKWGAAAALEELGSIELDEGNLVLARSHLRESLGLYRAVGEQFGAASALESLGLVSYLQSDYEEAFTLWDESLHLRREVGARGRLGDSLGLLGLAAARQGNYDKSRSLLKECLLVARQANAVHTIHRALTSFGVLESLQNNAERSALLFGAAEALRQAEQIQLAPAREAEYEAEISAARTQLPDAVWHKAWNRGSTMVLEDIMMLLLTPDV